MYVQEGDPLKTEFTYKKLCVYSYMFKLQSLSKYSPFDTISFLRCFFHCSKQFLNSSILMPISASATFCFTNSTSTKSFPLMTFSSRETNKNNLLGGSIRWIRRVGHGSHAIFSQKLLNTQCGVGRCAHKSPIMKWANTVKETSKKFTEPECSFSQQCQLVHWYRWSLRTLT